MQRHCHIPGLADPRPRRSVGWLLSAVCLSLIAPQAFASKHDKPEGPAPAIRIPSEPLGYHPLNSFYLMSRSSSSSLDFIDNDHLLFTFRVTGLLKRLADCQPDDEDQLIRALVVHLPDGNIVRSAEWRLHDRGRYLWALRDGRFLLRQRDSIFVTDSSLQLQPYIESASPIRLVKLSPDARMLLVENDLEKHTEDEHERLMRAARETGASPPREDVQMTIIRTADRTAVLRARALNIGDLPLIANGYIENLSAQGNHWMLRYVPFQGEPAVMADVASACKPDENPLSADVAFVRTCSERSDDHMFEAISVSGKRLWNYRWDSHYIWPTTATSENGRRIAFSTLRVTRPVSAIDPIEDTDLQAQRIDVLDVETGHLELTQFATPILSAGQNYALSPDSLRFAVLRENAIEIYDLPPAPAAAAAP
jgi:hypothetical protein